MMMDNKESFTNLEEYKENNNNILIKYQQFIKPFEFKEEWDNILNNYVKNMNNINIIARGYLNKDDLIVDYKKLILFSSTSTQQKINLILNNFLNSDSDIVLINFVKYMIPKIRLLNVDKRLDNGYPHTHNNIIIFSDELNNLLNINTLIHEMIHIDQRLNSEFYFNLYRQWKFITYNLNNIENFNNIINNIRVNPDGMNINWLWNPSEDEYYFIGSVFFKNRLVTRLSDVEYNIYRLRKKLNGQLVYEGEYQKIKDNERFNSFFNMKDLNNNYHPNEISADLIANNIYHNNINTVAVFILYQMLKLRFSSI